VSEYDRTAAIGDTNTAATLAAYVTANVIPVAAALGNTDNKSCCTSTQDEHNRAAAISAATSQQNTQ
jgi:predicted porin